MSRQPRRPRPPREPRHGAPYMPDVVPPPGFSTPIAPPRGFGFGGGMAQPPRRGPAPAPAAMPPPAAPAAAATPTEPAPPPIGAPAPAVSAPHAATGFADHVAQSDRWSWRAERQPQPQTESQLVLVWASILQRGFPPQSATIWIRAVDPVPGYEFFIAGDAVCGENPDRALWAAVRSNRRKPTVAERFVGRIRAPSATGQVVELGGGDLSLPPEPPAQPNAWSAPASPWGAAPPGYGPPPGYGAAGYGSPYGGPPPWWGAGGMGMPPPWWTATQHLAPAPPAAVQSDPAALHAWQMMAEQNGKMFHELITLAMKQQPPAAPAAPAPLDAFAIIDKLLGVTQKLRDQSAPDPAPNTGVTVLRVDEDSTLVLDKDGNVNSSATGWANVKHAKSIVQGIRTWRQPQASAGGGGGAQPPRRQTLPAGAATSNGKAPEKTP